MDKKEFPFEKREWTPLADNFVAKNGLVVEMLSSSEQLKALGDRFQNALSDGRFVDHWSKLAESGREQIYQVRQGDAVLSCGELHVQAGKVVVRWNRSYRNEAGNPESEAAVNEFARKANANEIDLNFEIGEAGFETRGPRLAA